MIYGNVEGIKRATLWQLKDMETDYDKTIFIDREVLAFVSELTTKYNREFSVFITRNGRIVAFGVGDCSTVKLADLSKKRSTKGLNGIRCIHTHPNGDSSLSDADLSALKANRFDCMCAVGVSSGKAKELSAGYLTATSIEVLRYKGEFDDDKLLEKIESSEGAVKTIKPVSEDNKKRAILVHCSGDKDAEDSLNELSALAKTLDIIEVARVIQKKERPDNEYYVGSGKLQEIAMLCQVKEAGMVIFDHQLNSLQIARIGDLLGCDILDRPGVILDIFAKHAVTNEGKLQVELARMKHLLPTLVGQGKGMSRQRGGLYAMGGGGETKLEIDRRHIRARIDALTEKLDKVKLRNDDRRDKRREKGIKNVAIVGYTNAGKSTLMNRITKAAVLEEDKLFATLDSVSRNVWQPEGEYLLTDTVGFINRLPHEFVEAFKSTLDEARYADLLLVVLDVSDPLYLSRYDVVMSVLDEIGAGDINKIVVYNKIDNKKEDFVAPVSQNTVKISARTGEGIEELRTLIVKNLFA